jgi:hypothetical protein
MIKVLSERHAGCNLHKASSMPQAIIVKFVCENIPLVSPKILVLFVTWCRESNPGLLYIFNLSLGLTAGHPHLRKIKCYSYIKNFATFFSLLGIN